MIKIRLKMALILGGIVTLPFSAHAGPSIHANKEARYIRNQMIQTAEECMSSVVVILNQLPVEQKIKSPTEHSFFEKFYSDLSYFFYGIASEEQKETIEKQRRGSGFFVSADGYIMTDCHTVKDTNKLTVVLYDQQELDAVVIAEDNVTDIAILKVEGMNFPFLSLGDSDQLEGQEYVVAISDPFDPDAIKATGIIGTNNKNTLEILNFIPTSHSTNVDKSIGPLINKNCEVVGVNAKQLSTIGSAIPSNLAATVLASIIKTTLTQDPSEIFLQSLDQDVTVLENISVTETVENQIDPLIKDLSNQLDTSSDVLSISENAAQMVDDEVSTLTKNLPHF